MADIVLTGDTSGAITVAAPAVAGTNTITLPANTGTAITSATAAADVPKPTALSTASGSAPSYSARAWVNFNGTGTVAINASGNVSSITDNGTGNYQVNFATAMPDANYSCSGSANDNAGLVTTHSGTYSTTTAVVFVVASTTGGGYDFSRVCVNYFR